MQRRVNYMWLVTFIFSFVHPANPVSQSEHSTHNRSAVCCEYGRISPLEVRLISMEGTAQTLTSPSPLNVTSFSV